MKKSTLLKRRAKELRELGENDIADQLTARAVALENGTNTRPAPAAAKNTAANVPKDVICWSADGRIFIQPPPCAHGRVTQALAIGLKKASTDKEGTKHYKYEGGAFTKAAPERSQWSFINDEELFERVKKVLGNFFSGAKIVTPGGEQIGQLPISTYVPKAKAS